MPLQEAGETLDCFGKIIKNTPAQKDLEHLRVIMDSNPGIPDRIAAILGDGESPVPTLIEGCRGLEKAGADFIKVMATGGGAISTASSIRSCPARRRWPPISTFS